MAARKKVITVKLVRGRVYVFGNIHYMRGVATEVTMEVAQELEELYDVVTDADGDEFEKPIFLVDYDAKPKSAKKPISKRRRLKPRSSDEDDEDRPRVRPKRRRV